MAANSHLLLIEDDPAVVHSLHEGLQRAGYAVTWRTQGAEGVAFAQRSAHFLGGLSTEVAPAPGIPQTKPDLVGTLADKKDNSLMVRAQTKGGGEARLIEVAVAGNTRPYRNATGDNLKEPPPQGTKIQMKVESWTAAQINTGDNLIVWGQRRGDRIVADVIMIEIVSPPATLPAGGEVR